MYWQTLFIICKILLIFHFFISESQHQNILYKVACQFSRHLFADCFRTFQNFKLKSSFLKLINLSQQRSEASSSILKSFWISGNIWKNYAIPARFTFLNKLRKQDGTIYFQGITWWLEQLIIGFIPLWFLFRLFFYCLVPMLCYCNVLIEKYRKKEYNDQIPTLPYKKPKILIEKISSKTERFLAFPVLR